MSGNSHQDSLIDTLGVGNYAYIFCLKERPLIFDTIHISPKRRILPFSSDKKSEIFIFNNYIDAPRDRAFKTDIKALYSEFEHVDAFTRININNEEYSTTELADISIELPAGKYFIDYVIPLERVNNIKYSKNIYDTTIFGRHVFDIKQDRNISNVQSWIKFYYNRQ